MITTVQVPHIDMWSDYEKLMAALKHNCKTTVLNLLEKKCCIFHPEDPNTPLHLAVEKCGYFDIVKILLQYGARVDYYNRNGDTALHHAFVQGGSKSVMNHMLKTYLKVGHENLANFNEITYLHIACAKLELTSVKKLLTIKNVNVDAQVKKHLGTSYAGYAPLHFAVQNGRYDVVSALLEAGANIYVSAKGGSTPLHLACRRRDVKMIDLLFTYDKLRLNYMDQYSMTHFMAACMSSNHRHAQEYLHVALHQYFIPARRFLSEVASSFGHSYPGYTPLHFAAEFGRLETVELLLTCIPPDTFCGALDARGETPVNLAEKGSHVEIAKALKVRLFWENYKAKAKASFKTRKDCSIVIYGNEYLNI